MYFELEGLPISTNASLLAANNRLIHTPAARKYRKETEEVIQAQLTQQMRVNSDMVKELKSLEGEPLFCHIKYYSDWITKTGTCRKKDICNLEKLLLDSVFSVLKNNGFALDDSQLYLVLLAKHDGQGIDKVEIHINIQERFRFI